MDNLSEVRSFVKKNLHGVAKALTVDADISLVAAIQILEDEGVILLWEDIYRSYKIPFTSAEEKNGELWLSTPEDTWVLRALPEAREKQFKDSMKKAGYRFNV